jgi:hypothetical protein
LRSKTNGVDPLVVRNGVFRLAWERLLPTNSELILYRIEPKEHGFSLRGTLPSAELYASMLDSPGHFDYMIEGSLSFLVDPTALPGLLDSGLIMDQPSLLAWNDRTAEEMADFVARRLRQYAEDPAELDMILATGATPRIIAELERTFPALESISLRVRVADFPDFTLYRHAAALYESYLERKRLAVENVLQAEAAAGAKSKLRFEELEKYGELLTKFPILLEYLAVEK